LISSTEGIGQFGFAGDGNNNPLSNCDDLPFTRRVMREQIRMHRSTGKMPGFGTEALVYGQGVQQRFKALLICDYICVNRRVLLVYRLIISKMDFVEWQDFDCALDRIRRETRWVVLTDAFRWH
jgi:hypothetical protein